MQQPIIVIVQPVVKISGDHQQVSRMALELELLQVIEFLPQHPSSVYCQPDFSDEGRFFPSVQR